MTARTATILRNIINVVACDVILTTSGFRSAVHQLRYVGVNVTENDLVNAMNEKVVHSPSVFEETPAYRRCGSEFRLDNPNYRKARKCIERVYEVTDTLVRTQVKVNVGTQRSPFGPFGGPRRQTVNIERVRPTAFAICMGNLRVRWARGNFSVPSQRTVESWFINHPAFFDAQQEARCV